MGPSSAATCRVAHGIGITYIRRRRHALAGAGAQHFRRLPGALFAVVVNRHSGPWDASRRVPNRGPGSGDGVLVSFFPVTPAINCRDRCRDRPR